MDHGIASAVLEARGLTKRFGGRDVLCSLDLCVGPGELYCLLGANGAGKTTTMNLFLGFLEPDAGEAAVDGVIVHRSPDEARRHLAFIPEQVMLYPELTGLENLQFFSSLGARRAPEAGILLRELEASGLAPADIRRRVSTYSKGMRQKVGIAIARARGAKTLLLDEPTSGLDPQASNEFSALLEQLKSDGVAILMATHDLFRAQAAATHVGILRAGRLVATPDPTGLKPGDLEALYLEHMTQ